MPACTTKRWRRVTKPSSSTSTSPKNIAKSIRKAATKPKPAARRAKGLPPPTLSEAAFERALAALDNPDAALDNPIVAPPIAPGASTTPAAGAGAVVDRLFARSAQYLDDPYSTIGDAPRFHTKIAGVSFEGRQDVIAGLRAGAVLDLRREPDNPHDANAVAVHYGNLRLGFLNKRLAAHLAPLIDAGARYDAHVASLTGGPVAASGAAAKHRGVNIFVERAAAARAPARDVSAPAAKKEGQAEREELAESVRSALIGAAQPHEAQRAVLERIDAGKNTLAVLGTGRGKSFCFQFAAALRAFSAGEKTLVVYPLRALANDQFEALRRNLDPLGLRCFRANGSIDNDERTDLFEALREGEWDVVLSTPEFLEFHRDALRGRSVPSLVVVDEAHHLAESRHRPAYARLAATIASLANPQVLALTATAGDESFGRIVEDLRIDAWIVDPTIRENLHVIDARGTKDKLRYLIELFGDSGREDRGKGIVYCNSRAEVTKVARALRKEFGNEVAFYHGRMPNGDRLDVERLFREGHLRVVIATSAFGEGIDLPDVADVVLYHLNFDFGEFNQQAGRAGRDGNTAQIHLLYGERDRSINEYLIDVDAPPLARLREIYRGLKGLSRNGIVHGDDRAIAGNLDIDRVIDRTVSAALRIFSDSSLAEIGEDDEGRFVRLLPVDGKVELERNERYAEGEATRDAFARFCDLALNAPAPTLERIINRPIYPSDVALRR